MDSETIKSVNDKIENLLYVISLSRCGLKASVEMLNNESTRILRIAERTWMKNKSEMYMEEYTFLFLYHNFKQLCDPNYQDDYVVGNDGSESSYDIEYRVLQ